MAERAKAAVMSIASNEKQTIFEKLWGKQPSQGSLLSYASADASVTGSIGDPPRIRRSADRRPTIARPRSTIFPRTRSTCPTAPGSKRIPASAPSSTIRARRTSGCAA